MINNILNYIKNRVIDFASLIIALCAFFLAYDQSQKNREHNRLSVMPYLIITTSEHNKDNETYSLELNNRGLGPAIITGIDIKTEKSFNVYYEEMDWIKIIENIDSEKKLDLLNKIKDLAYTNFEGKVVIPAGENLKLLYIPKTNLNNENKKTFKKILEKFSIGICYKSFYGDVNMVKNYKDIVDSSCNYKNSIKLFNKHINLKWPWEETPILRLGDK